MRGNRRQVRLLTRHFLRRFLDNDLIAPDTDLHTPLAAVIAALLIVSATVASVGVLAMSQVPAAAQEPDATPEDRPKIALWMRYEFRRDRFRYRFENPSSFDTTFTVPHYFTQSYRADNQWVFAGARYPVFDSVAETEFGLTPERVTVGDDYDTFFQPDGNIVVYGTTADVSLRSYRFSQRLESRTVRGWTARLGYTYQRDRSVFHPSFSTTMQSSPPSCSSFWNPARETTISEVHEIQVGAARRFALSRAWTIRALADLAPVRLAKLTTILPDKYPGEDLVFLSKGVSLTPRFSALWLRGRWAADLSLTYSATWNYGKADQFQRNAIGAGVRIGFTPR